MLRTKYSPKVMLYAKSDCKATEYVQPKPGSCYIIVTKAEQRLYRGYKAMRQAAYKRTGYLMTGMLWKETIKAETSK